MTRPLFAGLAIIAAALPSAAALAAGAKPQGMTLRCTGVPDYPQYKTVILAPTQIHESAMMPGEIVFVEPDAAVGFTYYEMAQTGKKLTGTAHTFSRFDWKRRSGKAVCTIIN